MRIEWFLKQMDKMLLYDNSIDNQTLFKFLEVFKESLSDLEKNRFLLKISILLLTTSKQKTIEHFTEKENIRKLETELNNLKNDKNDL